MKALQLESNAQISLTRKDFLDRLFELLIYSSIIMPSGTISGINFKLILVFILIGLIIVYRNKIIVNAFINIMPIIIFLLFCVFYSYLIYRFDSSFIFSQAKDILVFFVVFYVGISYAKNRYGYEELIKLTIRSVFLLGLIKLLIIVYSKISGIDVSIIIESISNIFGVSIMTFDVENSFLSRINFTSDSILPICIFFLTERLIKKGFSFKTLIVFLVICLSALLTMSRFQWAFSIVSVVLALLMNANNKKSFFAIVFLAIVGFSALSLSAVQQLIETRFDSRIVSASDIERTIQQKAIYYQINENPFFGSGIGSYIPNVIRSDYAKYSYELQIPALIMQLGFIGFFILIALIATPLISSMNHKKPITIFIFSVLIVFWLYGAMFNPILFSSSAGVVFMLIYAMLKTSR
ncbi:O-antigen ligase family protein [Acinetobacter baumannii]